MESRAPRALRNCSLKPSVLAPALEQLACSAATWALKPCTSISKGRGSSLNSIWPRLMCRFGSMGTSVTMPLTRALMATT